MTDKVNKNRAKGGILNGEKNSRSKLTKEQIMAIRNSKFQQKTLAKIYGVKQNTISQIINRKIWKHI